MKNFSTFGSRFCLQLAISATLEDVNLMISFINLRANWNLRKIIAVNYTAFSNILHQFL